MAFWKIFILCFIQVASASIDQFKFSLCHDFENSLLSLSRLTSSHLSIRNVNQLITAVKRTNTSWSKVNKFLQMNRLEQEDREWKVKVVDSYNSIKVPICDMIIRQMKGMKKVNTKMATRCTRYKAAILKFHVLFERNRWGENISIPLTMLNEMYGSVQRGIPHYRDSLRMKYISNAKRFYQIKELVDELSPRLLYILKILQMERVIEKSLVTQAQALIDLSKLEAVFASSRCKSVP